MKINIFLLLIFFLQFNKAKSQTWSCDQSTTAISTKYYPNTTSNITTTVTNFNATYLCGPNTIVYDTAGYYGCRLMLISNSATLISSSPTCLMVDLYYVKNGGTLIIKSNANGYGFRVFYEPLANIIDNSSGGVQTFSCTSILFPSVNCVTGVNEHTEQNNFFKIWPNPTSTKINIDLIGINNQSAGIIITNELGEIVFENKQFSFTNKEIPVDNLKDGVYFIQVKTKERQQREKFILIR